MTKRKLDLLLPTNLSSQMLPAIKLNHRESQLRCLLLDVSQFITRSGQSKQQVVVRWAGGWVRDKVLGAESHDIDVAVNVMTGAAFADYMCQYCNTDDAIQKHSINPHDVGNLHKVARNPEKSKHLETAMLRIFGLDVDIVNLRKETYAEDSRNPTVEVGTPEEDALRRDATINALFYNLHSQEVEDFTGGLHDLAEKRLRTPLDPLETFTDDPLRVLRLIRFASRLDFSIDQKARDVMTHPQVLKALKIKISRERVGTELEKMLKSDRPHAALRLVDKLNLYPSICIQPASTTAAYPDHSKWHVAYNCLRCLLEDRTTGSLSSLLMHYDGAVFEAWNLATFVPWMTVEALPSAGQKKRALPLVSMVARDGIKAPKKLIDLLSASYNNRGEILALKTAACGKQPVTHARDTLGMAIRKWDASGGGWTLQVLNALLVEAMESLGDWPNAGDKAREAFLDGWQRFLDQIIELDVYNAPVLKRLLDGRSLAQALGLPPGKWTGKALDICLAWQFRNPKETDSTGAIVEVKRRRDELGVPEELKQ